MNTIARLNLWLKLEGNTKTKLAKLLGYSTPETIAVWLRNKNIPSFQEKRVAEIIKNGNKGAFKYVQTSSSSEKEN